MKYVVYTHVDINNVPFYVGSGTVKRMKTLEGPKSSKGTYRGRSYSIKVNQLDYKYSYVQHFSSNNLSEVREKEIELYDQLISSGASLVNSKRPSLQKELSYEYLDRFVSYTESSPTYLEWKVNRCSATGGVIASAGSPAGSFSRGSGYASVMIEGTHYRVNRVIACLHGYDVSGKIVDHIDGNKSNNSIGNLRVIDHCGNNRNQKRRLRNTSGVTGVRFCNSRDGESAKWLARWYEDGVLKSKSFSLSVAGSNSAAFNLAVEFRLEKIKQMNLFGAGYSDRHGN